MSLCLRSFCLLTNYYFAENVDVDYYGTSSGAINFLTPDGKQKQFGVWSRLGQKKIFRRIYHFKTISDFFRLKVYTLSSPFNNKFSWINFTFVELPSAFITIPLPKLKTYSFLGFWFFKFWWPKMMRNWFSMVHQNGCTYSLLSKLNIFRLYPPLNIIGHFQIQANGFSAIQWEKRMVIEHIWIFFLFYAVFSIFLCT